MSEALTNVARHAEADGPGSPSPARATGSLIEVRDDGGGGATEPAGTGLAGPARPGHRAGRLDARRQPAGRADHPHRGAAVRIVIAEDSVLLRAGLTRLLVDAGEEVVARSATPTSCSRVVELHQPDLAVVDVRMPPTHTDDGLRAALEIRAPVAVASACWCSRSTSRRPTPPSCSPVDTVGARLPAEGPHRRRRRVPGRRAPGRRRRHRARPGGRRPAARPSSHGSDRSTALSPREREVLGAHGRGPLQPGDRRRASW